MMQKDHRKIIHMGALNMIWEALLLHSSLCIFQNNKQNTTLMFQITDATCNKAEQQGRVGA